ncbi:unnamed protein product [Paramecium primaurelia]|uniref:Uncharacterized protein n=1 Tax=Paramecium primaurelia TaxID=5886 RepID=A0A8S1P5J5_PARPR|nr:unnamed protein product [Paramecium primaurelia]
MDYYIQTIQQLQQTIQLASNENKELSQKLISLQIKYDPESDLQIKNLEKTFLLQQQQLAQLKQEKIKNSRIQPLNSEDKYQILQLTEQINEKEADLRTIEDLMYQTEFQIKTANQELSELKQILIEKQQDQIQLNKKAQQLENLIRNINGQDSLPMSYINEIDRLNNKLQNLEKQSNIQSRLTYQSYYKQN